MTAPVPVDPDDERDAAGLPSQDLVKMFALLQESNSIELKIMVPQEHRGAIPALGFDPVQAEPRETYFFDTPDLSLSKAGLFVRARRSPGGRGDTAIKLRPIDPATIGAELRRDQAFKIEVDANPGGYVCSGSAKGRCTSQEILDVSKGAIRLSSIFSRAQKEFFKAHAPSQIALKDLVPLGPTFLLRLKQRPQAFDRPVVVELWLYPDGSRIFEISTKGLPNEAFQLAAQFRALISNCGIPIRKADVMKTSTALDYHSKNRLMA